MVNFHIYKIIELTNHLFQCCHKGCHTYKELWEDLRILFKMKLFTTLEHIHQDALKETDISLKRFYDFLRL